jgi:hypothetical protein
MIAKECTVVGCESSAYAPHDLTPDAPWGSMPSGIAVCNLHKAELEKPDTEWMLDRNNRQVYVGDSLRNLNEYILVDPPTEYTGYGTGREFSHTAEDGLHIPLRVRRRGDAENEIILVLTSKELTDAFKHLGEMLP